MPKGTPANLNRAGRKPGVPNKANADLRAYAQQYDTETIEILMAIARDPENPGRVAAANAILDRGHGKAPQSIDMAHSGKIVYEIREVDDWRGERGSK